MLSSALVAETLDWVATNMYIYISERITDPYQQNKELVRILLEHDARRCKECGHRIGWGDIAWNNGQTEAGTGHSSVEIQCSVCQTEIVYFHSWYPEIEDREDLLYVMGKDWEKRIVKGRW